MDSTREVARKVWIVLTNTLLLCGLLLLLWEARVVIGWALTALIIAIAVEPAVAWLTSRGMRRGLAVILLVFVALGIFVLLVGTIVPMFVEQGQALVRRAPDLLTRLAHATPVEWADRHFHVISRMQQFLEEEGAKLAAPALSVAASLVRGVAATLSVVALSAFMLLFGGELVAAALAWFSPARQAHFTALAGRMQRVVGGYVAGTLMIASVAGLAMGITMIALGVPYFLPLALIMVVLSLVPILGSAMAAVVIVSITFASAGPRAALIMLVIFLAYQQLEGHVLQPVVQTRTINMNPLLITLIILAGTSLAGILGTLLALPLAGAIQVVLQDAFVRRRARQRTAEPAHDQLLLFPE